MNLDLLVRLDALTSGFTGGFDAIVEALNNLKCCCGGNGGGGNGGSLPSEVEHIEIDSVGQPSNFQKDIAVVGGKRYKVDAITGFNTTFALFNMEANSFENHTDIEVAIDNSGDSHTQLYVKLTETMPFVFMNNPENEDIIVEPGETMSIKFQYLNDATVRVYLYRTETFYRKLTSPQGNFVVLRGRCFIEYTEPINALKFLTIDTVFPSVVWFKTGEGPLNFEFFTNGHPPLIPAEGFHFEPNSHYELSVVKSRFILTKFKPQ
jgi:hypothetical protein